MLADEDRKPFGQIDGPEIRLRPASDAVRYQLIDVDGNKTVSSDARDASRGALVDVNRSSTEPTDRSPMKSPESMVSTSSVTSSVTSALRHTPGSVNISPRTTATSGHVGVNTTVWKTGLRLETAPRTDSASGDHVTTESSYRENKQSATSETLGGMLANALRTKENAIDSGSRKVSSLLLTISGENRLRGSSLDRSSDVNATTVAATESREQHADQSASTTTRLPEVSSTAKGAIENGTDAWNVEEPSGVTTRSTADRVRYVHTLLTEDGDGGSRMMLGTSQVASISAAGAFCLFFVLAVVVFVVYRRRRIGRSKMVCGDGWKSGAADEKLKVLRRVAAESDTLSPDLLDQIIRAELARGRAKRYRARLRDGDDREQLERLAVELSDDWGTPPPSYRRLTPVAGPAHRRPLWTGDSPARVHDLPPPPPPRPELPPPVPQRSFARPTVVPLDFRQFRRPLPEIPRHESAADQHEMTSRAVTPMKTVRCDRPRCDVITASPHIRSPLPVPVSAQDGVTDGRRDVITRSCDVIAASPRHVVVGSPLPVSGHAHQDGGTGSEVRRRFPKMGRSCLLESYRQRGDSVDAGSGSATPNGPHFRASLSPEDASRPPSAVTGCACATDLHRAAVTSWTRDLSQLPIPILRDTTV